jgi:hypothetical protein
MSDPLDRRRNPTKIDPRWLSAIDRVLLLGIKISPTAKSNAINKVLEMVPPMETGRLLAAHSTPQEKIRTCREDRAQTDEAGQSTVRACPGSLSAFAPVDCFR